jgi:hypothetical protein
MMKTGIVFVLMAIRTHAVREEAMVMPPSASFIPDWLIIKGQEVEVKLASERNQSDPTGITRRSEGDSTADS